MINFLPPKEKKVLLEEKCYKLIFILNLLLLSFLISLSLILFSIKIYIQGDIQFQNILIDSEKEEFSQFKDFKKKIISLNQEFLNLNSFYQNQIYLTTLLEKISVILPSEMYLTNFSYQKENSKINLRGFSPTREILLEFKNNLKKEKEFEEVYFPPSNWVKAKDINFSATFIWSP